MRLHWRRCKKFIKPTTTLKCAKPLRKPDAQFSSSRNSSLSLINREQPPFLEAVLASQYRRLLMIAQLVEPFLDLRGAGLQARQFVALPLHDVGLCTGHELFIGK